MTPSRVARRLPSVDVMSSVELFRAARAILAESLWWDADAGAMRWCDITAGTLHRSRWDDPTDGSGDDVAPLGPPLASFQPTASGGLVAAFLDAVETMDADGASRSPLARLPHPHGNMRLNEGKCDPFGSFVVGSMDLGGDPDGSIWRVRPDGSSEVLVSGVTVANGFEWSDDGRTFFFTDTDVKTVYRAEYDPDGPLGEPEPHLVGHSSDGLALDVDGCFWNGCYGEGRVIRWTPDGRVDAEIEVPAPNVTSVAFGGPDLSTLLVATARENLTEEQLEDAPHSGDLFALATSTSGRPVRTLAAG